MDTVEFVLHPERPPLESSAESESFVVPYVNWLLSRLILASPAQLTAEPAIGDSMVSWHLQIFDPPGKSIIDTTKAAWFRIVLARLALCHIGGSVYGGHRSFHLRSGVLTHRVALYLGNSGLVGYWFRGYCSGGVVRDEPPPT